MCGEQILYYCPINDRTLLINTLCDSTKLYSFSSLPRKCIYCYLMSTVSASLNALFRQELKEEYPVISSNSSSSAGFSDKRKSAEICSILRSGSKLYTAGISCSKHTNNELDTTVTPESPLYTSHVFLDTADLQYGNLHTAVTEVAVVSSCNLITLANCKTFINIDEHLYLSAHRNQSLLRTSTHQ